MTKREDGKVFRGAHMKKIIFLVVLTIFAMAAFAADALDQAVERGARPSKKWQSEFNINGGDFLGDEWHNTWSVGAKYYLHINDTFAVGATYMYSPIITDWDSTFGRSLTTKQTHVIDGELMISNDAAFRSGKSIIEFDMYFTLGMGVFIINRKNEPVGMIGGGIKIYTPVPWLVPRIDVNTYIHPTPNLTGDVINADMGISGGVSFLFPVRKVEKGD